MRRSFLAVLALTLVASFASAEVCYNPTTGACSPNIFGTCPEGFVAQESCPAATPAYCFSATTGACGPASIFGGTCPDGFAAVTACPTAPPVATPTPTPVPTPEPGLLDKVKLTLNSKLVLKLLGFFASMVIFVQTVKKVLEKIKDWEWLLKMVPQLGVVISFLTHGIGPIILNAALTFAVGAPAVLADNVVTLREIITLIGLSLATTCSIASSATGPASSERALVPLNPPPDTPGFETGRSLTLGEALRRLAWGLLHLLRRKQWRSKSPR